MPSLTGFEAIERHTLVVMTRASFSSADTDWSEDAATGETEGGHSDSWTTLRPARAILGDHAAVSPPSIYRSVESWLLASTGEEPLVRPMMPELDSVRGIAILMVLVFHDFSWDGAADRGDSGRVDFPGNPRGVFPQPDRLDHASRRL